MSDKNDNTNTKTAQGTMSRRDWFRLRRPKVELMGSEQTSPLRPTEQPPNHDGMDLSELPPMHEAILNESQVRSLFSDIEQYASEIRLIARRGPTTIKEQTASLRLAADNLLGGRLNKMQIRYHWQSANWIDTLEQQPQGFRLIRIQHQK